MFSPLLQQVPWLKLTKFVITGGIALAIDVAIYYLLTRHGDVYYLLARTISLGVAILWNFSINRFWTFQATTGDVRWQALKFVVVIGATSLLSLALMHVGVTILEFHDLLVLLSVAVLTTLINFSAHSLWSYAEAKEKKTAGSSFDVPPVR